MQTKTCTTNAYTVYIILIQTLNYAIFKSFYLNFRRNKSLPYFFPKENVLFLLWHTHTHKVHTRLYIKAATHTSFDTTVKIYIIRFCYLTKPTQRVGGDVIRTAVPWTWMCRYYIPTLWKTVVWRRLTTSLACI